MKRLSTVIGTWKKCIDRRTMFTVDNMIRRLVNKLCQQQRVIISAVTA